MLTVLSFLWLCLYSCQASGQRRKEVGCEGREVELSCEGGREISVIRANYGRISSSVCGDQRLSSSQRDLSHSWSTRCIQPRTLREVTSTCSTQDPSHCRLEVNSQVFGDPCPNTPKYLEVVYTCERKEKVTQPPLLPPWLLSLEAMENIIRRKSASSVSTTTTIPTTTTTISSTSSSSSTPSSPAVRRQSVREPSVAPLVRQPSRKFLSYLKGVRQNTREGGRVSLVLNRPREQEERLRSVWDRDVIAAIVIACLATVILLIAVVIVFCCNKSRTKGRQQEQDLESSSSSSSTYLSYGTSPGLVLPSALPFPIKCGQTGQTGKTYEYTEVGYTDKNCRLYSVY